MNRTKVIRAALTALTLAMGAALIVAVLRVYSEGLAARQSAGSLTLPIFTRERAALALRRLLPLFWLWLAALIAGLFVGREGLERPVRSVESELRLLRRVVSARPEAVQAERKRRVITGAACGGVIAGSLAMIAAWLTNGDHFASWELEAVMGELLRHTLPWLALAAAALLVWARLREDSWRRECAALRAVPKDQRGAPAAPRATRKAPATARLLLYACALALIALGIANGGMNDVLVKAINICTECIGLG